MQAAKNPHADLSAAEVQGACRASEHLLYLTQAGRRALEDLGACLTQVNSLDEALATLEPGRVPCHQQRCREWLAHQQQRLPLLEGLTADTASLLAAAAAVETAKEPKASLLQGAAALQGVLSSVQHCTQRLTASVSAAVMLRNGSTYLPPAVQRALCQNAEVSPLAALNDPKHVLGPCLDF